MSTGVFYCPTQSPCRSWLASEGVFERCVGLSDAFAGKPAPTGFVFRHKKCPGLFSAGHFLLQR
ncbi:hypothetical protein EMIT0P218_60121 [Pseudomonas sp. IT-P218]